VRERERKHVCESESARKSERAKKSQLTILTELYNMEIRSWEDAREGLVSWEHHILNKSHLKTIRSHIRVFVMVSFVC